MFLSAHAEPASGKIEVRLTEEPALQILDHEGKVWHTLAAGTVRKRVAVQNTLILASFGKDNQHRSVIMLSLDMSANQSAVFLFGGNIMVVSPEAVVTLQLSPDNSSAQISPSLMGQVRVNGNLVSRGETAKIKLQKPVAVDSPSPDQPRPSVKDFQSIPKPAL